MGSDRIRHPQGDDIGSNVSLRATSLEGTHDASLLALHSASTWAQSDMLLAARGRLQLDRCERRSPRHAVVSSEPSTKDLDRFQESPEHDFYLATTQLSRPTTSDHHDVGTRTQLTARAAKPRPNSSLDTIAANSITHPPTHRDPEARAHRFGSSR